MQFLITPEMTKQMFHQPTGQAGRCDRYKSSLDA